jgi:hypothetical protein
MTIGPRSYLIKFLVGRFFFGAEREIFGEDVLSF